MSRGVVAFNVRGRIKAEKNAMAGKRTRNSRDTLEMPAKNRGYEPLPSVWYGSDAELLERMIDFYPKRTPKRILDATVNAGRFWVGSTRNVIGMDIDPRHKPDLVGDNTAMPFADE